LICNVPDAIQCDLKSLINKNVGTTSSVAAKLYDGVSECLFVLVLCANHQGTTENRSRKQAHQEASNIKQTSRN